MVYSDKKWLRFIIEQIIINGVKYSKDYGKYLIIKNIENEDLIQLRASNDTVFEVLDYDNEIEIE